MSGNKWYCPRNSFGSAPTGRRTVATGEAPAARQRAVRNPWKHSFFNTSAPKGRRNHRAQASFRRPKNLLRPVGESNVGRDEIPACCFAGGTGKPGFHPGLHTHPLSTGSASGRFAAAPLHPWLHPFALLGLPPVRCGPWPQPTAAQGQCQAINGIVPGTPTPGTPRSDGIGRSPRREPNRIAPPGCATW